MHTHDIKKEVLDLLCVQLPEFETQAGGYVNKAIEVSCGKTTTTTLRY